MKQLIDVNLSLGMEWENTSYIHEAVLNIIQSIAVDEPSSERISMVSTELIENALKYGDPKYMENDAILFSIKGNREEITIEVKNRATETEEKNIQDLDTTIQWVRAYQSAFEAYVESIKRTSKQRNTGSKLGIARIAYEGQATVDFFLDENNRVAVSAIIQLEN